MMNVLAPEVSLLAKIGSIVVHIDEAAGDGGHHFDWIAIRSLLADQEVQFWIAAMGKRGFVPVKRS